MKTTRFLSAALAAASLVAYAPSAQAGESGNFSAAADSVPARKSGSTAFLISALSTFVPAGLGVVQASGTDGGAGGVLVFLGTLVGPSAGHFYAGKPGRALRGIGIRAAAVGGMGAAFAMAWNRSDSNAEGLAYASLAIYGVSALVDIATAPGSARAHNQKIARSHLNVAPVAIGPARTPGLRVDWTF